MKTKKSLSEDSRQQENSGVLEGTKAERETNERVIGKQTSHVFLGITHVKVSGNHVVWISMA